MATGIAVVGLDHWYTAFGVIETAAASSRVPLISLAELRPERLAAVLERYPNHIVLDNADDAINRPEVALVAVCATTDQAPEIAIRALSAGKHVLSVKPPARTLAQLEPVLDAAKAAGRFYGSFEGMQRLSPRNILLRELIQGGAIGTPLSYHQVGHGGLPAPWPGEAGASWWLDADRVPGGAWIDHAIYAVDLARYIFDGEVTFATGLIEKRVHPNLALEDYGISLMRLSPNGGGAPVSLSFENTWAAEPGGGAHQQWVIGSAGNIRPQGSEWVVARGKEETKHPIPDAPFFGIDALAALLEQGETPPFGLSDARANLKACLEVYETARVISQ